MNYGCQVISFTYIFVYTIFVYICLDREDHTHSLVAIGLAIIMNVYVGWWIAFKGSDGNFFSNSSLVYYLTLQVVCTSTGFWLQQ